MKPFLLLATRDDDRAAADEYAAVAHHCGLGPAGLHHLRVEAAPLTEIDLDAYSGLMLGGSGLNSSAPSKSPAQQRIEADLERVIRTVIDRDYPFLGMCYGVGVVTSMLGGTVGAQFAEPVGAIEVTLTAAGRSDRLLAGVGDRFAAFVGHKEACTHLPRQAVTLATGTACPTQMYRVGANVYVTQFHPELNAHQLAARMRLYEHAGYFQPAEMEELIARAHAAKVGGDAHQILANFVRIFAR